jgi:hypothetical protein
VNDRLFIACYPSLAEHLKIQIKNPPTDSYKYEIGCFNLKNESRFTDREFFEKGVGW